MECICKAVHINDQIYSKKDIQQKGHLGTEESS